MGCCLGRGQKKDEHPFIIDVQQTIADAAWDMFYYSESRFRRLFLKRSDYTIEVPMNYYHFQEVDYKFYDLEFPANCADDAGDLSKNGNKSKLGEKKSHHTDKTDPEHAGLVTDFKNSTGEKQTYNFKFEKARKATTSVTYQKGFSIGGRANFSIGLPKVLPNGRVGTAIDMRVTVTKTAGETFEETLTTCATSDITVAPRSHYTATVVMEERTLRAAFTVWVMMSMPAKESRAFIKNKQGETIFFYKLRNLAKLFPEETHVPESYKTSKQTKDQTEASDPHLKDKESSVKDEDIQVKDKDDDKTAKDKGKDERKKVRKDAVKFVVEGVMDGVQLASHHIKLIDHDVTETGVQTGQ